MAKPLLQVFPMLGWWYWTVALTYRRLSNQSPLSRQFCRSYKKNGNDVRKGGRMQFVAFHLMPWPHLPADFEERYESAWITCPNRLYDRQEGHLLYNRYLDELEYAEQLGFDVIGVNEHHQNAYGMMPSPNIMAACLARRTSRAKLLVFGNALPLYDHPLRVAEEIAILDAVSGGRVISGMVVGLGAEAYSY